MASIIILGNRASTESLTRLLAATEDMARVVVAEAISSTNSNIVNSESASGASLLNEILQRGGSEKLLFIDARAELSRSQITSMVREMESDTVNHVWMSAVETETETVELPELSAEAALKTLSSVARWPMAVVGLKKELAQRMLASTAASIQGLLVDATISAIAESDNIAWLSEGCKAPVEATMLNNAEVASAIRLLVDNCNIEDIFPNHDWVRYQGEAAAASYHSLAAIFLRLNDIESANECIKLSDQFEDSPRSLALKGLIAERKGEILGAVANMVSSLQAYESRKKNEQDAHYLTFSPLNIEVINEELRNGLQALNKRDNERALVHFSEAVFSFDSFYREFGVRKGKE